jgi:DNA-directed RNA polymerase specialized sigma24 family protein
VLWSEAEERFAAEHPHGWKLLAIMRLREVENWSFAKIGGAFGQSRGSVCRQFHRTKAGLKKILGGRCAGAG